MAAAPGRHDAPRTQQEDELLEQGFVAGQLFRIEAFVGVLIGPLVVEAGLADGGNDDPIAGQVDGVAVALIDRGHAAAGERPVQRIERPLALQGHDEPLVAYAEVAQHGIGELAVHLDVLLAGNRMPVGIVGGAGVAQHVAKHVGQKVAQDLLFLEAIGLPRRQHIGPLAENRPVFL